MVKGPTGFKNGMKGLALIGLGIRYIMNHFELNHHSMNPQKSTQSNKEQQEYQIKQCVPVTLSGKQIFKSLHDFAGKALLPSGLSKAEILRSNSSK